MTKPEPLTTSAERMQARKFLPYLSTDQAHIATPGEEAQQSQLYNACSTMDHHTIHRPYSIWLPIDGIHSIFPRRTYPPCIHTHTHGRARAERPSHRCSLHDGMQPNMRPSAVAATLRAAATRATHRPHNCRLSQAVAALRQVAVIHNTSTGQPLPPQPSNSTPPPQSWPMQTLKQLSPVTPQPTNPTVPPPHPEGERGQTWDPASWGWLAAQCSPPEPQWHRHRRPNHHHGRRQDSRSKNCHAQYHVQQPGATEMVAVTACRQRSRPSLGR